MNETRRLAVFVPTMDGGGAERVMATLVAGFAARGIPTDLLLASARGPFLEGLPPEVRIVDFGRGRVLASLPSLVRYLRRERPFALLSAMSHTNVIALLANRFAGSRTRIVISERCSWAGMVENFRSGRDRVLQFMARRTYRRADAVIVVATAMIDELHEAMGISGSRIHMIPNPVVSEGLVRAAAEPAAHPFFGQTAPVIVGAGRLSAQKDFETLIRAFALLRGGRDARLVIIGEGEDRAALEELVRGLGLGGDVALPGFAANPFPFMRAASLFVLSSRFEGMPGVLIQAMACGTPVVSTDCPTGPREILEDGRWGALVPVGDAERLAAAMAAALDSHDRPDVRQRAADFDVERSVDRYLDILLTDAR